MLVDTLAPQPNKAHATMFQKQTIHKVGARPRQGCTSGSVCKTGTSPAHRTLTTDSVCCQPYQHPSAAIPSAANTLQHGVNACSQHPLSTHTPAASSKSIPPAHSSHISRGLQTHVCKRNSHICTSSNSALSTIAQAWWCNS